MILGRVRTNGASELAWGPQVADEDCGGCRVCILLGRVRTKVMYS